MKKYFALIIIILTQFLYAQTMRGIVFEDTNSDGKFNEGESVIPGVIISNKTDFTKTDNNGEFTIECNDPDIVFVVKPAGYRLPVDKNNLPVFWRHVNLKGSPADLEYPGIKGSIYEEYIHFPLLKSEVKTRFSAVLLGDPQPQYIEEVDYIKNDVASELAGSRFDFGIALGDILFDDLSFYDYYNEVMSKIEIPIFNVAGNHDENYDVENDSLATETFHSVYGPTAYSFNEGKVHFVVLDNVEYLGEQNERKYIGKIGTKQLEWLKKDLSFVPADNLVVINVHIPFVYSNGRHGIEDLNETMKILDNFDNVLVLAGHTHTLESTELGSDFGRQSPVPVFQKICGAVCGSWWSGPKDERGIPVAEMTDGSPNGYAIAEFDGTDYYLSYKAARFSSDYQMRISYPEAETTLSGIDTSSVYLKVFNGDKNWQIKIFFDDKLLQAENVYEVDPFTARLYDANKDKLKSWVRPQKTRSIWKAPVPEGTGAGIHVIRATAFDGKNEYTTSQIITVKE